MLAAAEELLALQAELLDQVVLVVEHQVAKIQIKLQMVYNIQAAVVAVVQQELILVMEDLE